MLKETIEIQSRLDDLRLRFVVRMHEDREMLAQAWEKRDHLTLGHFSHKLAGIAGSFGFPDVGNAAADLQKQLDCNANELTLSLSITALLQQIDTHKAKVEPENLTLKILIGQ